VRRVQTFIKRTKTKTNTTHLMILECFTMLYKHFFVSLSPSISHNPFFNRPKHTGITCMFSCAFPWRRRTIPKMPTYALLTGRFSKKTRKVLFCDMNDGARSAVSGLSDLWLDQSSPSVAEDFDGSARSLECRVGIHATRLRKDTEHIKRKHGRHGGLYKSTCT
jgi:hypothetical protein